MNSHRDGRSLVQSQKYTLTEASQHFRVSVRTVRRWVKSGKLTAVRPAHFYLVTGEELERALARRNDTGQAQK